MNGNKQFAKTFCEDCRIRVKLPQKKNPFLKEKDERPPVEYSDGYRCADCAQIYRQKQSYKQSKEADKVEDKQGSDDKIIRAI